MPAELGLPEVVFYRCVDGLHPHRISSAGSTPRPASPSRVWMIVLIAALGFLAWINSLRIDRVERVTDIALGTTQVSAESPTGYARGFRALVVPERLAVSQECIALTQQMFARGEWRVREFDRENAPFGRPVHSTFPYRGWLGLVAGVHHLVTGQPIGISVERAALYADPLLHALWLIGATLLVARLYGSSAASLVAAGGVTLFPCAAAFLPGVPEERSLAWVLATSSVLLLLGGVRELVPASPSTTRRKPSKTTAAPSPVSPSNRWFVLAGVSGGLGVWNNAAAQVPILIGLTAGALLSAWLARKDVQQSASAALAPLPWRSWGLAGAITILIGWLFEFFPVELVSSELRAVHPLYALAWLGGSELVVVVTAALHVAGFRWNAATIARAILALAASVSVPAAMYFAGNPGFFFVDSLSFRMSKQVNAVILPNVTSWIAQDGFSLKASAVFLPLVGLGAAIWFGLRSQFSSRHRQALALTIGPAIVGVGLAYFHLGWWQIASGLCLIAGVVVVGVASTEIMPRAWRWGWPAAAAATMGLGAFQILPGQGIPDAKELSVAEAEVVVGRHLAEWIARRSSVEQGAIILAPPGLTSTLSFHGSLRGLASLSWENKDGLAAALRMVISTSRDETHALIQRRELNYIVLPSWDPFFDSYVRSASVQVGSLFLPGLQRWVVPPWLRPIPYEMPKIPGFENHAVVVFQVVEEQEEPAALSRLTEYFIEMSQPENAQAAGQSLRRFPADFGALVARAQLESALGQTEALSGTMDTLVKRLGSGGAGSLEWDRRVSLATVLARTKRYDLAREQVRLCVADIDEARIRSLTPYGLYHFLGLCKGFAMPIPDPTLRELAVDMLPAALRAAVK